MNSNPASDDPAGVDRRPFPAEGYAHKPGGRFSPLASLIMVTLLSLGTWAAIWAAVASLMRR